MAMRYPPRRLWMLGWLLLALAPPQARSQEPAPPQEKPPEMPAREAYQKALEKFARGQGGSMENVFALARSAAREQLQAVIEWDEAFARGMLPKKRFHRTLPGFHVGLAEALYVIADSGFFVDLARQRGTAVDKRFFEMLDQTYLGTTSRAYVDPITDVTGCYHLGSREFLALYRGWTRFQASYPKAYPEVVKEEVEALEQTLLTATCACSSREVVDAGLEDFLKAFPKSPIAAKVRERLEKIHTKTSGITFRCGQELPVADPLPQSVQPPAQ